MYGLPDQHLTAINDIETGGQSLQGIASADATAHLLTREVVDADLRSVWLSRCLDNASHIILTIVREEHLLEAQHTPGSLNGEGYHANSLGVKRFTLIGRRSVYGRGEVDYSLRISRAERNLAAGTRQFVGRIKVDIDRSCGFSRKLDNQEPIGRQVGVGIVDPALLVVLSREFELAIVGVLNIGACASNIITDILRIKGEVA